METIFDNSPNAYSRFKCLCRLLRNKSATGRNQAAGTGSIRTAQKKDDASFGWQRRCAFCLCQAFVMYGQSAETLSVLRLFLGAKKRENVLFRSLLPPSPVFFICCRFAVRACTCFNIRQQRHFTLLCGYFLFEFRRPKRIIPHSFRRLFCADFQCFASLCALP